MRRWESTTGPQTLSDGSDLQNAARNPLPPKLASLLRESWWLAFVASVLGAIGNAAYTAATPGAMEAMGIAMPLVIIAICAFFIWYAWTMTKRGVLR